MKNSAENSSLAYGIILTLFAYVFFALCSTCVKIIGKDLPTIEIIFFQSIIPFICLLPKVFSHKISYLKPVAILPHFLRDISGIASFFTYFWAIKYLGLIDATVLSYTGPFYVPFFWSIWTKEKFSKDIWWAITLGFIGVVIILKPKTGIFNYFSFIGILSGMLSALSLTAIGMLNRKKEVLTVTLFYNFLVASLISLPLGIIYWKNPTLTQWFLLLGIGFFTFIAQILLTKGYKHGAAAYLSPLSYSIVIYTTFISSIFLKEQFNWVSFIGIACVIIGGTVTYVLKKRPKNISEVFEKAPPLEKKHKWHLFGKKEKK